MKFPIGFSVDSHKETPTVPSPAETRSIIPRKSVVQVHFPSRNMTIAYYNDRFNLHHGDFVFVEGKLEGLRGRVVDVNYSFKIKLSDYKRVIAVADTQVEGEFFFAGSHFVTFDPLALPFEKAVTWFKPPEKPEDEYVSGDGGESFPLDHLEEMGASRSIAERGADYYRDSRVVYISVTADGVGHAIVEGSEPYTVEFRYENGTVSDLTCACFCSYPCKHEFAAMLQLKEVAETVEKHYAAEYAHTRCFAAVGKATFLHFAVDTREHGSLKI